MTSTHTIFLGFIILCSIVSIYILYHLMNGSSIESFLNNNSVADGRYYIKMSNGRYLDYSNGNLQPTSDKNKYPTTQFIINNDVIYSGDGHYDVFSGNQQDVLTPSYASGISSIHKYAPLIYNGDDNTITNMDKKIVLGMDGMSFYVKTNPQYPIGKFTLETV